MTDDKEGVKCKFSAGDWLRGIDELDIEILNGKTKIYEALSKTKNFSEGEDHINFSRSGNGFNVDEKIKIRDKAIFRTVEIENTGTDQLWFEVRLALKVPSSKEYRYWDGYSDRGCIAGDSILAVNANPVGNEQELPDKYFPLSEEMQKEILKKYGGNQQAFSMLRFSGPCQRYVFQMSCIFNEDECLCLGIVPDQHFSYYSGGMEKRFYTSVKLVVDPGTKERVTFLAYKTPGKYGWREALQKYYDLYPEYYTSRKDIDQRFLGISETSGYTLNYEAAELVWEDRRRYHVDWTWSMHAYPSIGIFFPTEDDYEQDGPFMEEDTSKLSCNEFIRYVRESYRRSDTTSATAYYVLPQMLTKIYADKHCPDALWQDSNGKTVIGKLGSSDSPEFKREAYPILSIGNSYEQRTFDDLRKCAEEYRLCGFAFDNVEGQRMDFAPHTQNCPGRAFADGKVYVTQAMAYGALMRYVREMTTPDGKKMAVTGNGPGSYHTSTFLDATIVETGPWSDPKGAMALRCITGSKPIVYWGPKEFADSDTYVGKALEDKLVELNDWLFIFSLRTGILPNAAHNIKGYPKMLERLPLLKKVLSKGWQAVPGATASTLKISVERFGNEYLTVVNENMEPVKGTLEIELRYFLSGTGKFILVYGNIIGQTVCKDSVKIEFEVPAREALVLRSDAAVDPPDPIEVMVDENTLLDFPFIDNDLALAEIVLEEGYGENEHSLARRISTYFRYYYLQEKYGNEKIEYYYQTYHLMDLEKHPAPRLPVVSVSRYNPGKPGVFLHIGAKDSWPQELRNLPATGNTGCICVSEGNLHICGVTVDGLEKAVLKFLSILDKKYVYIGQKWFAMRRRMQAREAQLMSGLVKE